MLVRRGHRPGAVHGKYRFVFRRLEQIEALLDDDPDKSDAVVIITDRPLRDTRTVPFALASRPTMSLADSMRIFTISRPTRFVMRTPSPSAITVASVGVLPSVNFTSAPR